MSDQIIRIDVQFTSFITNILPHYQFLDFFFSFFSQKGSSILIWVVLVLFLVIFEEKKRPASRQADRRFIIYFLISFLTAAFLVNIVAKNVVRRPRPPTLTSEVRGIGNSCPKDYSFPSGHAATAFAAASILVVFDRKRKWFYYVVALLISFSRIYLGCHFFSDVLIGALIGYLISKFLLRMKLLK